MANYTTGRVIHYDGTVTDIKAGYSDQVHAAKACGVDTADLESGKVPVDYPAQLAYAALRREGKLDNLGYEAFLETIADMELDEDPESQAPPA